MHTVGDREPLVNMPPDDVTIFVDNVIYDGNNEVAECDANKYSIIFYSSSSNNLSLLSIRKI